MIRVFPILTSVVAVVILYLIVFERELLFGDAVDSEEQSTPATLAQAAEQAAASPITVVALRSEQQTIEQFVQISGVTAANRQVEIRSETAGIVVSEPLRKGSSVADDTILCRIDPGTRQIALREAEAELREAQSRLPEAEARLTEAEARLAEASLLLTATKKLAKDGFASETRLAATQAADDAAKAGLKSAQSALAGAKAGVQKSQTTVASATREIEKLEIRAPFSGQLESDTAEIGSLLRAGELCATIIQLNPIKLVGFVLETDVDKMTVGAPARGRLATGGVIEGIVTFLAKAADPSARTFRVEATVPNPNLTVRDGQTAEIFVSAGDIAVHFIPQSALTLGDDGILGVRVITKESTARFRPVTVVRDSVDGVFVSGLAESVDLIIVGQEFVGEDVAVSATYREIQP